jgi:uncharacterized protein
MEPSVVSEIQTRLDSVIVSERIAIPLAVESGSRAWGFPSPDSDYDCRFVYVRQQKDYMALFQKRDVIELPLTPVFDVNGWDLQKAIKLLLKGNAVILEWLQSPIVYRKNVEFSSQLLNLAETIVDRAAVYDHYFHLLEGTLKRHFSDGKTPSVKKLFYILRPAMAMRQMRINPSLVFPSMNLQQMIAASELGEALQTIIQELLAKKAVTRELGSVAAPPEVISFVMDEMGLVESLKQHKQRLAPERVEKAEQMFLSLISKFAPE